MILWKESLGKQSKNISIRQENTMLMKHLFKLPIFQYEISAPGEVSHGRHEFVNAL